MRSWAALGAFVGGLGPFLGPFLAILATLGPLRAVLSHFWNLLAVSNRSWDLCRRSWAALGAFVGDLGQLLGPVLAALGCLGAFVEGGSPIIINRLLYNFK